MIHEAFGSNLRSHASLDHPGNFEDALPVADPRLDTVADVDSGRWFGRNAVDAHVSALAQRRRQRASLGHAHRAQPSIDACLVHGPILARTNPAALRHRGGQRFGTMNR